MSNGKIITLPDIATTQEAVNAGVGIDRLRRSAVRLAAEGLLSKIGTAWTAETSNVPAIVAEAKKFRMRK